MQLFKHRRWRQRLTGLSFGAICLMAIVGNRLWSSYMGWAIPYPYSLDARAIANVSESLNREMAFYRDRIQNNPADGLDRAALAQTYVKMARATGQSNWYLLAEQSARQSLANLPVDNTAALLALAQIAAAKHEFTQTVDLTQQVLTMAPENEAAQALLATAYLAMGRPEAAHQVANQLVQQLPTLGSFTLRALAHEALCRDQAAIADFQKALALEEPQEMGSSAWTRTLLGRFYAERGELAQAKQLYQDALRIVPRYPLALIHLAELETQQGHYRQAQQRYSRMFSDEDYPATFDHMAIQGLAQIKLLQGDRPGAEERWALAEQQFRDHQDLDAFGHRPELARLLLSRGRADDVPEALALLQQELTIRRDPKILNLMAWALSRQHKWEEAQAVITDAIAHKSCDAETLYRAAQIEDALGHPTQALNYRQQAKTFNPTFDPRTQPSLSLAP